MKNWVIIVVCILLLLGIHSCNKKKEAGPAKVNKIAEKQLNITGLQGLKYSIKDLPDSIIPYLKTKSDYKDYYNQNKKFVIYFTVDGCPYNKAFVNSLEPFKTNSEYSAVYNFYAQNGNRSVSFDNMEDFQADEDFHKACSSFCIVNPVKKQVFAINDGAAYKDLSANMGKILDKLKNW